MEVEIQKIPIDDVFAYDRQRYNTNNNWPGGKKPDDYDEVLAATGTSKWVDKFHKDYRVIDFDESDVRWMKEAAQVGIHTGKFSTLYEEELEETLRKYSHIAFDRKYFVRTEKVSLKSGMFRAGPYTDLRQVIMSMCSCRHGHGPFSTDVKSCRVYLLPWLEELTMEREFRLFVYREELTAISTQNIYVENRWLSGMNDEELTVLARKIKDFYDSFLKGMMPAENVVVDLALLGDRPYFIEPNSFGAQYASGSALFSWADPELYDSAAITLRILG